MRSLITIVCAAGLVAVFFVASAEAKGGRGGGGGGRGGFSGGRGGQQGGAKFSGQQARGGNRHLQHSGPASADKHSGQVSSKPNQKSRATAGNVTDGTETANKKQKQLEIAQRQREKRLAQADHLREIAERNGNQNLAANADRMEAQADQLYQQRLDHLSKFGVTDPAVDPGSAVDLGGVTDPGVIDSVGDLSGPDLLLPAP